MIGHIGFERDPDRPERAEVAMEIADAMQDKGLGTILLGRLAEAAREVGVQVLTAEVLPENHQMIKVFRDSGFPVRTNPVPGTLLIEFRTARIQVQAASPVIAFEAAASRTRAARTRDGTRLARPQVLG